jgi:HEPN domain-containing protein
VNNDVGLNDFAIRCFRDVADQDYIAARLTYRAGLFQQFHWASLQALEKYLKAILLLNRIKAKDISHNLSKALNYVGELPFELRISEPSRSFIDHIDAFGRHRYLESSFYIHGPKILELDRAVWEVRRYCQIINYDIELDNGEVKNMLGMELEKIKKSEGFERRIFKLPGGFLEKVVEKKDHPSRQALVWQNAFFGLKKRKNVTIPLYSHSTNAPLYLHPEIIDDVVKYVKLPKGVVAEYRRLNSKRKKT